MTPVVDEQRPVELEIERELQKELLNYPGKWVAMTRTKIIAVGDSVPEVLKQAIAKGEPSPSLYRVPEGRRSYFF